jgi:glycine/D-amino acid oxidase-like deaminating enzyme
MDLRSGQCYWPLKNGLLAVYPTLDADASCEVAIVGGGITGALIAHRLTHAGRSCILVDKRDIGWGSTLASTALLQYEIDTPLRELSTMIGPADAARAYRLCHSALALFERLVSRLRSTCSFQRRPSLYLAREQADIDRLRAECRARTAAGLRVEFLLRETLRRRFSIDRPCAILSADAAQVDPFQLTHALLADAIARGLRTFDRVEMTDYLPTSAGATLTTDRGPTITARHTIFATGYEAQAMLSQKIVDLRSTYALATEPIDESAFWPDRCLIWEAAEPYFYLRSTRDGRALMGGEDIAFRTPALRDRLIPRKSRSLIRKFHSLFPAIPAEPAFCWAGTFGQTADGLAYCGQSPEYPGALFALGFGGNGMTFGILLAAIIDDLVAGRPNEDARLFRFDR